mmetsp:Transcript_40044/g.39651  ORF Transcript_40044/g.39651 Transcript_40044/m.39651 type:complete len:97 (+) Transcript_40044:27-317(+)
MINPGLGHKKRQNLIIKKALILTANNTSKVYSSTEGNPAMKRRGSFNQKKLYKQYSLGPKRKLKRQGTLMNEVVKKLEDVEQPSQKKNEEKKEEKV